MRNVGIDVGTGNIVAVELEDGELVSICRVCGQKWKIIVEEGDYYLVQLPKNARFEFEDKLKVEE